MIPSQSSFSRALAVLFSVRKSSRRSVLARRRFLALRATTARQRFGMASRAAALFGTGAAILLGSQPKISAQTVPGDVQYQYQNSTGLFSTGFTPTLGAGSATAELNFSGTGPYTATVDSANVTANNLSFFGTGLVTISSSTVGNTITLGGTTPGIFVGGGSSALINTIFAGTAGLVKFGTGTLTLGAANTYTGATTVSSGVLALDFTQAGAPATNILAPTSTLRLNGGTLQILGAAGGSTQTFANTAFTGATSGLSVFSAAPAVAGGTNPTVNLGTLTGTQGALVRFVGAATEQGASSGTTTGTGAPVAATATFNTTTNTVNSGLIATSTAVGSTSAGAGAFATVGLYDWAAISTGTNGTAQTGTIVGGSQVPGFYTTTGTTTTGAASPNLDLTASAIMGANSTSVSSAYGTVRFNTAAAITFTTGRALSENVVGGVLVTPNVGANNTTIAPQTTNIQAFQASRSTTGASGLTVWQNNPLGELVITAVYANGTGSAATASYTQGGPGTVVLNPLTALGGTSTANGYTGPSYLDGGTTIISAFGGLGGGTAPASLAAVNLNGGALFGNATTVSTDFSASVLRPVVLNSVGGTLAAVTGGTFTLGGVVSGTGGLTIGTGTVAGTGAGTANTTALIGGGTVILSNAANTYSGGTTLNAGTLQLTGAIGQLGTGGVTFNGGTFQYGTGATADISSRTVTLASGAGTIDTNGGSVTFANSIGNGGTGSLTKVGLGTLTLSSANSYGGATIVNAGSLLINNATGSGTGTGDVTVSSGGTFGGSGISTGTTTVSNGGFLVPGGNTTATLTLGNLTLADNSTTSFGFGAGSNSAVTTGTLSLNGTDRINLYQVGTATAFATAGTYTLFTDTTLSGSVSSLMVANPAANTNYAFSVVGNTVRLTISGGIVTSSWNVDSNGNYSVASNWTNGVPNAAATQAIFGTVITAPRTVTVDGTFTVGEIDFNNANAYTLTPGAAGNGFVFNNGGNNAVLNDSNGTHVVQAPIALGLGLNAAVGNAADKLTLSGVISNTGAAGTGTLTKTGSGTLALLGANTFDGGVTITNGTVQINSASSLGATTSTATLDSTATAVTLEALNSITTARAFTLNGTSNNIQVDGASIYEIDGVMSAGASGGTLTKTGPGTLALGANNLFAGIVTVSAGTLSLGAGGTAGSVSGNIIDNAALVLNRSDAYTLGNLISGTGTLTQTGSGNTTLSAVNTFTGTTTIAAGTLTLGNAAALQNSTLNYDNQGGTLSFGTQTAATLGGLTGSQTLALSNAAATPAGVTLTLGNNNVTSTFGGILSGLGSVAKTGTGTVTLNGANTYAGATSISAGTLTLTNALGTSLSPTGAITANGGTLNFSNATVYAASLTQNNTGASFVNVSGTSAITLAGTLAVNANSGNSGAVTSLLGGTLSANAVTIGRDSTAVTTGGGAYLLVSALNGLYVNGGALNVTNTLSLGTATAANSNVLMRVDSGSVTVGGTTIIAVNNGGRASFLDIEGGTFTSNDTVGNGIQVGGVYASTSAQLEIHGGTLNTPKITLGTVTQTSGTDSFVAVGGTSYIGAGGIVALATGPAFNVVLGTNTLATAPIIAASADWSSSLPMTLTNSNAATAPTFQAADAGGAAHNIALSGVLSGAGGLTKTGPGMLTLAGPNTYTGATTVNAGTLNVSGSTASGSAVTVNTGGTLSGAGGTVAGTVLVNGGGTLLAGMGGATPTVGDLTTGALTLSSNSVFSSVVGGDNSFSRLLATSVSAAGSFSITLTGMATFAATGEALTLIPSGFSGAFTNASFTTGGYTFTTDLTVPAGVFAVDVTTAVPEPTTLVGGLLLLGLATVSQRRRLKSLLVRA